tara:strand:- start:2360 stop:2674 length:315 start_codon:yes stop_codon:yes gene_type:complete
MSLSRYNNFRTIIHEDTNDKRLETFPKITAAELISNNDIIIVLNDSQRIDALALQYLGDGRLWWVICLLNDFVFPFGNNLVAGTKIRIPTNVNRVYELIERGII